MNRFYRYILRVASSFAALSILACQPASLEPGDRQDVTGFNEGEQIVFGAAADASVLTKSGAGLDSDGYFFVKDNYDFNITMLTQEATLGTATYSFPEASQSERGDLVFNDSARSALIWYDIDNTPFAFRAEAGSAQVNADQSTKKKLLDQDRMSGYAGYPGVDHGTPVFMTAKAWYEKNKEWMGLVDESSAYKRIPLYLKHDRAKISVILRAGEGVERENLAYNPAQGVTTAKDLVAASIFSYGAASSQLEISPFLDAAEVDYGSAGKQMSACFEAIVDPFNYMEGTNAKDLKMVSVNLSGLKFSFRAANDNRYADWERMEESDEKAALKAVLDDCYNLTAGKHLVLDVTLSTATRKVLITAYVTDWDDRVFNTVCDDNGTTGDSVQIDSQEQLSEFLKSSDNKPGKVAYISSPELEIDETWEPVDLKATLNAAGATIKLENRLFKTVSGRFVNANIIYGKSSGTETVVPEEDVVAAVVALENTGVIERVTVSPLNEKASAQKAGLVVMNQGTIYKCESTVPVHYTGAASAESNVFIGGIAAVSMDRYDGDVLKAKARIESCIVNARVDEDASSGSDYVYGGGIVGQAQGVVVNNSYEYGMTLSQDPDRFRNIMSEIAPSQVGDLAASGNSWPTTAANHRAGTNANDAAMYDNVLDCASELKRLVLSNSSYNSFGKRYLVSDSFTVDADGWKTQGGNMIGSINDSRESATNGNVFFELDGNGKEITLSKGEQASAPMLFTNIMGYVHDLTIVCKDPVFYLKTEDESEKDIVTAIAPLAFSVSKYSTGQGTLSNVNVVSKDGVYVEAMAPAGLVVWAYDGAVIEKCSSDADIRIWKPAGSGSQGTYFAGGLVNSACDASFAQCRYQRPYLDSSVIGQNDYYGGIVGGASGSQRTNSPSILFTDCASRLTWTGDRPSWGGIIGYAIYEKDNVSNNATREGCQGNWWDGSKDVHPVGKKLTNLSYDQVIGKKNSVSPDWDTNQ